MIAKMIAAGRVRGGGVVKRVRRPGEESETGEGCDVEGKLHSIVHDRCRFRDPPPPRAADPTPARICVGTPVCTSRRRSPRPGGRGAASGDGRVSPFRRPRPPPERSYRPRQRRHHHHRFFVNALAHARTLCTLTPAALSPRKGAAVESR